MSEPIASAIESDPPRRQSIHAGNFSYPIKCLAKILLLSIGLYTGISVAIPGAILIHLERFTHSREDEIALVFSARAVGSLSGWLLGTLMLDSKVDTSPSGLLGIGVAGTYLVYFLFTLSAHTWWAMLGFVIQGCFAAFTTCGCIAYAETVLLQVRRRWTQHLMFACLLGCVFTPFIVLPFYPGTVMLPQMDSLSAFVPQNHSRSSQPVLHSVTTTLPPSLQMRRFKRELTLAVPSVAPPDDQHTLSNESVTVITNKSVLLHSSTPSTTPAIISYEQRSPQSTTKQSSIAPTKPSVVDAMHLNQDSSSADGSHAASKMKELGEERRINKVGGASGNPASIFISVHLPNDHSTQSTVNSTEQSISVNNTSVKQKYTPTQFSTASLKPDDNHTSSSFGQTTPAAVTASSFSKGNVTLASLHNSTTKSNVLTSTLSPEHSTTTTTTTTTASSTPSSTNTVARSTTSYEHLAEHSPSFAPTNHLLTRPFLPIQRFFIFVGLLGLLSWLLLLPVIGWCRSICDCLKPLTSVRTSYEDLRMRRVQHSFAYSTSSPKPVRSQSDVEYHPLLSHEGDQPPPYECGSNLCHTNVDPNGTQYLSANEDGSPEFPNHKAVSGRSISLVELSSPNSKTHVSDITWPRISWPSGTWLLLAQFFNIGLETTFGAFIHWFTVRYLLWNSAVASLALSLFWLGGLVGRLPCLFLVETKLSPRSNRLTHLDNPQRSRSWSSLLSSSIDWLLSMVRLCGSVLCVISAVALTRLSVSTARYAPTLIIPNNEQRSAPRNYFTWLGGSLFLGLGVGVSSSGVDPSLIVQYSDDVHRLQLAGHLGQMLVPPVVAYLHHLAVFRHFTHVLGTSILVLSILLSLTLLADVMQTVMCRSREVSSKTSHLPTAGNGATSSVTLYAVSRP